MDVLTGPGWSCRHASFALLLQHVQYGRSERRVKMVGFEGIV